MMFYEKPVVLNSETHKGLKIRPTDSGLGFAAKTNSVMLAGVEFPEASRHFPIVFAKAQGDKLVAYALLGFRNQENLFVDGSGKWQCEYVPAFIRRYPFVLAEVPDSENLAVCIDEAYSGFNSDQGQPLFDDKGEASDYLKTAVTFLQDYQMQLQRTQAMLTRLQELDLLKEVSANVKTADGEQYTLAGMLMVDEAKFAALADEQVVQLFRSGELAWIYSHLISMANFRTLLDKAAQGQKAA